LVKKAGERLEGQQTELLISEESDPTELGAYGELLHDAIQGDSARFARQDYVEESWRIIDPVLTGGGRPFCYEPGSWGPVEADRLADAIGGWDNPAAS
jgi:glucose-6-phosphate 1-dehydrogenase